MNIFEAGVLISLIDRVSPALAHISTSMSRTQTAAAALQTKLNAIGSTFKTGIMFGVAGAAVAAPIVAAAKAASEYSAQINRMNSAGFSHKEMVDSIGSAWKTTNSVITSGVTENLKIITDIRSVVGDTKEAIAFAPAVAKMQGAYKSVLDGKVVGRATEQSFAVIKALDMIGQVKNTAEIGRGIGDMFRVTEATGGKVLPSDYQQFYKYARQARYGLSDEFKYKVLPELLLESKGGGSGVSGGVGPSIAALFRVINQGIVNKAALMGFQSVGMVPAGHILKTSTTGTTVVGGLLGADLEASNPLKWVQEVLIPHIAKFKHISPTDTAGLIKVSNSMFRGNQLAASQVAEFIKKPYQYERFGKLYKKTDTLDQAYDRGMDAPNQVYEAFGKSLHNLKTAIGESVMPVIIPALRQLATSFQRLGLFLHDHPQVAEGITGVTSMAAGALLLNAGGHVAKAAGMSVALVAVPLAKGIGSRVAGLIPSLFGPMVSLIAGANLKSPLLFIHGILGIGGALLKFLGPVGLTIAAIMLIYANWDKITKFINEHQRFFIHIAAVVVASIDWVSSAFQGLLKTLGAVATGIGKFIASIPGMSGLGQSIMKAADGFMKVDDVTAKRDEKYLIGKGLGDLVGAIKGTDTAAAAAKGTGKPAVAAKQVTVVHDHSSHQYTVQEVKGHDHKECAKTLQKATSKLQHAASAAGGNSVGRSGMSGGMTRP